MPTLTLYQELILLALSEEKGEFQNEFVGLGVAASIMAELLLTQRIQLSKDKHPLVLVTDTTPTGDHLLDRTLDKIAHAKRKSRLSTWVQRLNNATRLRYEAANTLVDAGIVKLNVKKRLWLFSHNVYPEVNPEPERRLRHQLRELVLNKAAAPSPRLVVLLALAEHLKLQRLIFSKQELAAHKDRIRSLMQDEAFGKAAQEAIQAIQTAVLIAVIIPAVTVTVS